MHPILNVASQAVRKAGDLIAKKYEIVNIKKFNQKNNNNCYEIENLIIDIIHKFYPSHTIIGEKCGKLIGKNYNIQWIINPLDSVTNFVKCFPHFATSIAVRVKGNTEIAVIYDPIRNELFSACRGQGARLNGYRIRNNNIKVLDNTILATSFLFKQKQYLNNYITLLSKLFIKGIYFRSTGSITLDLAYVASGRIDGFFDINLKPYYSIGGELLIRESGGVITDFNGNHNSLSNNIIAGSPKIIKTILSMIALNKRSNISNSF